MCSNKRDDVPKAVLRRDKPSEKSSTDKLVDCPACGGLGAKTIYTICGYCGGDGVVPKNT